MVIEILMPALSPTMTEGNLAKWYKKEGDQLKAGEIIAEIETDKATMEVEAVDEGILAKILVNEGVNQVRVGKAIALIVEDISEMGDIGSYQLKEGASGDGGKENGQDKAQNNEKKDKIDAKTPAPSDTAKTMEATEVTDPNKRIFASPLARRIADQKSLNLSSMNGTGPHGRIVKSDVIGFIPQYVDRPTNTISSTGAYDIVSVSNMKRVIAKRLIESKQNTPHFYLTVDCKLDNLLLVREQVNFGVEKHEKISVNDFIIKASALALARIPEVNASWTEEGIKMYHDIDISVAVAIDGGLVTPIVRSANLRTISDISAEMKGLALRAKNGKLKPEEYQGGGFSISNLGMFGIKQFNAIINPPQSCILAVGAGIKKPVVIADQVTIATVAELTISCDHRVVDGACAAKLLSTLVELLENPIKMLVW